MVVLLHRHADRQIVDDGDHFAQVLRKQPVKQHLVAIVQGGQIDVLAQRIRQPLVLDVGALDLISSVLMSGGSRPVRPSAFRSSAVKAVPLFNSGELSTASPRALVS